MDSFSRFESPQKQLIFINYTWKNHYHYTIIRRISLFSKKLWKKTLLRNCVITKKLVIKKYININIYAYYSNE